LGGQPFGFRRPSLVFIFVKLAHNLYIRMIKSSLSLQFG